MLKKKVFAIAGASILTVSLLAGATYAWFTSQATASIAEKITAGEVKVVATVTGDGDQDLFPQLTMVDPDDSTKYLPDLSDGGSIDDVVHFGLGLENQSTRQVLVRIGSDIQTAMEIWSAAGVKLDNLYDIVKVNFDLKGSLVGSGFVFLANMDGYDYYYADVSATAGTVPMMVWIDGRAGASDLGGVASDAFKAFQNEYQGCHVNFNNFAGAEAVQYRKIAAMDTFGLTADQADTLAGIAQVDYE